MLTTVPKCSVILFMILQRTIVKEDNRENHLVARILLHKKNYYLTVTIRGRDIRYYRSITVKKIKIQFAYLNNFFEPLQRNCHSQIVK